MLQPLKWFQSEALSLSACAQTQPRWSSAWSLFIPSNAYESRDFFTKYQRSNTIKPPSRGTELVSKKNLVKMSTSFLIGYFNVKVFINCCSLLSCRAKLYKTSHWPWRGQFKGKQAQRRQINFFSAISISFGHPVVFRMEHVQRSHGNIQIFCIPQQLWQNKKIMVMPANTEQQITLSGERKKRKYFSLAWRFLCLLLSRSLSKQVRTLFTFYFIFDLR